MNKTAIFTLAKKQQNTGRGLNIYNNVDVESATATAAATYEAPSTVASDNAFSVTGESYAARTERESPTNAIDAHTPLNLTGSTDTGDSTHQPTTLVPVKRGNAVTNTHTPGIIQKLHHMQKDASPEMQNWLNEVIQNNPELAVHLEPEIIDTLDVKALKEIAPQHLSAGTLEKLDRQTLTQMDKDILKSLNQESLTRLINENFEEMAKRDDFKDIVLDMSDKNINKITMSNHDEMQKQPFFGDVITRIAHYYKTTGTPVVPPHENSRELK
ncbi:MAG: hypothetical protein ACTSXQ_06560 [Alphaproteobacteria bacterium]